MSNNNNNKNQFSSVIVCFNSFVIYLNFQSKALFAKSRETCLSQYMINIFIIALVQVKHEVYYFCKSTVS